MKKWLIVIALIFPTLLWAKPQIQNYVCEGTEVLENETQRVDFAITYKDLNPQTLQYTYEELNVLDSLVDIENYQLEQLRILNRFNRCVRLVELKPIFKSDKFRFEYLNKCQVQSSYHLNGVCWLQEEL